MEGKIQSNWGGVLADLSANKEDKSNKTTSISSSSTNTQYPSAKAVFDACVNDPSGFLNKHSIELYRTSSSANSYIDFHDESNDVDYATRLYASDDSLYVVTRSSGFSTRLNHLHDTQKSCFTASDNLNDAPNGWSAYRGGTNSPTGNWCYVLTIRFRDDGFALQIAFSLFNTEIYTRRQANGSWTSWTQISS